MKDFKLFHAFSLSILIVLMFSSALYAAEATIDLDAVKGKTFGDAFQILMDQGFYKISPVPVKNDAPKETVLGIKINGRSVRVNQKYNTNSDIKVLVSMGSGEMFGTAQKDDSPDALTSSGQIAEIQTQSLMMTGRRFVPLEIATESILMTGRRFQSLEITTDALFMTGRRTESLEINTEALMMTGRRFDPIEINTQSLLMTGRRFEHQEILTVSLKMTGIREEASSGTDGRKETLTDPPARGRRQPRPSGGKTPAVSPSQSETPSTPNMNIPGNEAVEPVDSAAIRLINRLKGGTLPGSDNAGTGE